MPEEKLSHKEFVLRAIRNLRNPESPYKGIHVVYSGFNQAFREYFKQNPVPVVDQLIDEGVIEKRLVKGGVLIYVAGEAPEHNPRPSKRKSASLQKILDNKSH